MRRAKAPLSPSQLGTEDGTDVMDQLQSPLTFPYAFEEDDDDAQMQQFSKESAEVNENASCFLSVVKAPAMGGFGIAFFEASTQTIFIGETDTAENLQLLKYQVNPAHIITPARQGDALFSVLRASESPSLPSFDVQTLRKSDFDAPDCRSKLRSVSLIEVPALRAPSASLCDDRPPEESQFSATAVRYAESLHWAALIDFDKQSVVSALSGLLTYLIRSTPPSILIASELGSSTMPDMTGLASSFTAKRRYPGQSSAVTSEASSRPAFALVLRNIRPIPTTNVLHTDAATRDALGVFVAENHPGAGADGGAGARKEGLSLWALLNRTVSPPGTRLLKSWVRFPSTDIPTLKDRLDHVSFFADPYNDDLTAQLRAHLRHVHDVSHVLTRFLTASSGPRDWEALSTSLQAFVSVHALVAARAAASNNASSTAVPRLLQHIPGALGEPIRMLNTLLSAALEFSTASQQSNSDGPSSSREMILSIKRGVDAGLDALKTRLALIGPFLAEVLAADAAAEALPHQILPRSCLLSSAAAASGISRNDVLGAAAVAGGVQYCYFPQLGYLLAVPCSPPESEAAGMFRSAAEAVAERQRVRAEAQAAGAWTCEAEDAFAREVSGIMLQGFDDAMRTAADEGGFRDFCTEMPLLPPPYDDPSLLPPGCSLELVAGGVAFYSTPRTVELGLELGDLQTAIADAERDVLMQLSRAAVDAAADIDVFSTACSELDAVMALAVASRELALVRPRLSAEAGVLHIAAGRHLLTEQCVDAFVPNSLALDPEGHGLVHVISGPNNSGKSVFLRQVGISVYLAHVGSFVPAASAVVGICDRIAVCSPSPDCAARGVSTFAADVVQTGRSLRAVTRFSLLLVDEFGVGTNGHDGAALAAAVLRYLERQPKDKCPRCLFTTHFHELKTAKLVEESLRIRFFSMQYVTRTTHHKQQRRLLANENAPPTAGGRNAAYDEGGDHDSAPQSAFDSELSSTIVPLFRVAPGWGGKSFGLSCARAAGVPMPLIMRAVAIANALLLGARITPTSQSLVHPVKNEPLSDVKPPPSGMEAYAPPYASDSVTRDLSRYARVLEDFVALAPRLGDHGPASLTAVDTFAARMRSHMASIQAAAVASGKSADQVKKQTSQSVKIERVCDE